MNQLDLDCASLLMLIGDLDVEIMDKDTLARFGISGARADAAYAKLIHDGFMNNHRWRRITEAGRHERNALMVNPPMSERDEQVLVCFKDAPSYGIVMFEVSAAAATQGMTKNQMIRSIANLVRYGLMDRYAYNSTYVITVHGRHIAKQLAG